MQKNLVMRPVYFPLYHQNQGQFGNSEIAGPSEFSQHMKTIIQLKKKIIKAPYSFELKSSCHHIHSPFLEGAKPSSKFFYSQKLCIYKKM